MQNDNGKLLISKPTLESIVISVLKEFSDAEDVDVMVELDSTNNVIVNITLTVNKDVVIKELTLNIQNKVRETIKKTSDLEVKAVNVKVKNVAIQKGKERASMEKLQNFWNNYKGAIIGVIIALLVIFTRLYALIIGIILIVICAFIGNYVQQNKEFVKDKIKDFIDRL